MLEVISVGFVFGSPKELTIALRLYINFGLLVMSCATAEREERRVNEIQGKYQTSARKSPKSSTQCSGC